MKKFAFTIIITLSAFAGICQTVVEGVVLEVIEGDILLVLSSEGDIISVKLQNIECPEINQAYGDIAKAYTKKACLNKSVTLNYKDHDKDRNALALVHLKKGKDLGSLLLEQGLAWHYVRGLNSTPETSLYIQLEQSAKDKKRGLWNESEQVAPWTFRNHQNKWEGKTSI